MATAAAISRHGRTRRTRRTARFTGTIQPDAIYTTAAVKRATGLGRPWITRQINAGTLPFSTTGGRRFFLGSDLIRAIRLGGSQVETGG
jgi:predicted DNA-binding transcriptional regulator AlpA